MVIHQVQDSNKRFQPLDTSVVDEMMHLLFQGKVRQVLVLKLVGLQVQKQKLLVVVAEKGGWGSALGVPWRL